MDQPQVKPGMRVISRDGIAMGTVAEVEAHGFTVSYDLKGGRHRVGLADVAAIDERVHLDKDADFFPVDGQPTTQQQPASAPRQVTSDAPLPSRGGLPAWVGPLVLLFSLVLLLLWYLDQR